MSLTEAKYELKSKKDEDDPKYTSHEGYKKKKKDKKKKNKDVDVKVKLDGSPPKSKAEMLRGSSKESPGYPPAKERASQSPSVCDQLPESAKAIASSIKTDKARYEPQEDVFMKSERDRSVERPDDRSKRSSLPGDKSELKLPYHRRESQGNGGQSDMSYVEDHDDSMQEYDGHYGGRFHQRQNSEGGFQPGRGFDKKRRNQPWNSDRNQASRGSWSDPRGPDASRGRGRSRGSWSDPRGHDDRRRSFPSPQGRSPANTGYYTPKRTFCKYCHTGDHSTWNCSRCYRCKSTDHSAQDTDKCEAYIAVQHIRTVKGKDDVLSNFYGCRIYIYDHTFTSAEHAYHYQKALFYEMGDVANQIIHARDALAAKGISKQIPVDGRWEAERLIVLKAILAAKLDQIPEFARELLDSGTKTLAHNTTDLYWGTGFDLELTLHTKQKYWPGQNVHGKMLEEIRDKLFRDRDLEEGNVRKESKRPRIDFDDLESVQSVDVTSRVKPRKPVSNERNEYDCSERRKISISEKAPKFESTVKRIVSRRSEERQSKKSSRSSRSTSHESDDSSSSDSSSCSDSSSTSSSDSTCTSSSSLPSHNKSKKVEIIYGKDDVLSNYYSFTFEYKKKEFDSVYQAFQWRKAMDLDKKDKAEQILETRSNREIKELCKSLDKDQSWDKVNIDLMEKLLEKKAKQLEAFNGELLKTGGKVIVNADENKFWGTGCSRQETNKRVSRNKWPGRNKLGELLIKLRRKAKYSDPNSVDNKSSKKSTLERKSSETPKQEDMDQEETLSSVDMKLDATSNIEKMRSSGKYSRGARDNRSFRYSTKDMRTVKGEHDKLSNFYPCTICYNGENFASVEHVYQWKKAMDLGAKSLAKEFRERKSAQDVKELSLELDKDQVWEKANMIFMGKLLRLKAKMVPKFRNELLETGDRILAHNVEDCYWGTGLDKEETLSTPKDQWPGMNIHGELLMSLRKELLDGGRMSSEEDEWEANLDDTASGDTLMEDTSRRTVIISENEPISRDILEPDQTIIHETEKPFEEFKIKNIICFDGKDNLLSIYFRFPEDSMINIYGHKFPSAAHAYAWKKASEMNECMVARQVELDNFVSIENLLSEMKHKNKDKGIMKDILLAKLNQIPEFKKELLSTGKKILAFANADKFWGTGLKDLSKMKEVEQNRWPGWNNLGHLLEDLRLAARGNLSRDRSPVKCDSRKVSSDKQSSLSEHPGPQNILRTVCIENSSQGGAQVEPDRKCVLKRMNPSNMETCQDQPRKRLWSNHENEKIHPKETSTPISHRKPRKERELYIPGPARERKGTSLPDISDDIDPTTIPLPGDIKSHSPEQNLSQDKKDKSSQDIGKGHGKPKINRKTSIQKVRLDNKGVQESTNNSGDHGDMFEADSDWPSLSGSSK